MRRTMRLILMVLVLAGFVAVRPAGNAAAADAVVAAPCTETDFDAALATVEGTGGGTITFDCGGPATITLSGEKEIATAVQIDGADLITISGGDVTRHFRVLGGGSLTLEQIILEDGYEDATSDFDGGSIWVEDGGALVLRDSTLQANRAEFGGALYLDASTLGVDVTIDGSALVENEATNGGGGAIYSSGGSRDDGFGARMTISDSLIADNIATDYAGAIFNGGGSFESTLGSEITINGSSLMRNTALSGSGGAIFNSGGAFDDAGGGSLTITDSTLAGNVAGGSGGAILNDGGAFDNSAGGTVLIQRSTLTGNEAGDDGGALFNSGGLRDSSTGGDIVIRNSTLSGNVAGDNGGAINNVNGFDPDTTGGTVRVLASTITLNDALSDDGDGIFSAPGQAAWMTRLRLTIVAENDTAAGGVDCEGAIFSDGRNLDSDDSCQLIRPHDVPAGIAALLPLADNGGPTETHLPSSSSDVRDAGPASCISQDQRQQLRPGGANCDIGAVEVQPAPPITLCVSFFTGQIYSPASGVCDPAVYYEVDMPNSLPQTFCYDPATGALSHAASGVCPASRQPHTTPADGDLLTCVSIFTGIHRWGADHSQCSSNELAVVVPAV